jgi:hypothetical protein
MQENFSHFYGSFYSMDRATKGKNKPNSSVGGGRARWMTITSSMGGHGVGKHRIKCHSLGWLKIGTWYKLSQFGLTKSCGNDCHIETVGPRFGVQMFIFCWTNSSSNFEFGL